MRVSLDSCAMQYTHNWKNIQILTKEDNLISEDDIKHHDKNIENYLKLINN